MPFFSFSSIMCKHRCHLLGHHSEGGRRGTFFEPPARIQFFESQSRSSHVHTGESESRIKKIFPRLSDFLDRESGKMVCVWLRVKLEMPTEEGKQRHTSSAGRRRSRRLLRKSRKMSTRPSPFLGGSAVLSQSRSDRWRAGGGLQ